MTGDAADLAGSVDQYLRHAARMGSLSAGSLDAYRHDLDRFRSFCATRRSTQTASVTSALVEDFQQWLTAADGAGLAESTAARTMAAVRGMLRWAHGQGVISSDPAESVLLQRSPRRPAPSLTEAEVRALLRIRGEGALGQRDHALVSLLYHSGARASEAIALDLSDVTGDGRQVQLGATDHARPVSTGGARAALIDYLSEARPILVGPQSAEEAVFVNARGRRLSRQSCWGVVRRLAAEAGLDRPIGADALRHARAVHLLAGGMDEHEVQRMLGHVSLATTRAHIERTD